MQDNQKLATARKCFTIAEADAMLPLVQSIASDICSIFRSVTSRRADLHRLLRKGPRTSGQQYDDEMAESRADLQTEYEEIWKFREELETLGVLLRQPEDGKSTCVGRSETTEFGSGAMLNRRILLVSRCPKSVLSQRGEQPPVSARQHES